MTMMMPIMMILKLLSKSFSNRIKPQFKETNSHKRAPQLLNLLIPIKPRKLCNNNNQNNKNPNRNKLFCPSHNKKRKNPLNLKLLSPFKIPLLKIKAQEFMSMVWKSKVLMSLLIGY